MHGFQGSANSLAYFTFGQTLVDRPKRHVIEHRRAKKLIMPVIEKPARPAL
jgi:hypothetical protein